MISALVYWKDNDVNSIIASDSNENIDKVTIAINGSLNAQVARQNYTKKAFEKLK